MKFDFLPKGDMVLIEFSEQAERLGLIIPERSRQKRYFVRAVGDDVKRCAVGDEVLLDGSKMGSTIPDEGCETYLLVQDEAVLGVYRRRKVLDA